MGIQAAEPKLQRRWPMTTRIMAARATTSGIGPIDSSALPQCTVISGGGAYLGTQGLPYSAGISTESAGARGICLHLVTIPPGGRAKAHLHENHETAIYMLCGEVDVWCGEGLREHLIARAGDFVYIPAGVPHVPVNRSQTEGCSAVIARTDPKEQESVVLLPELDELAGLN